MGEAAYTTWKTLPEGCIATAATLLSSATDSQQKRSIDSLNFVIKKQQLTYTLRTCRSTNRLHLVHTVINN